MGQSWNGPAVRSMFTVLTKPSLLSPSLSIRDLSNINVPHLKRLGIKGLVLDKDNTITAPYALHIHPQVEDAMVKLMSEFPDSIAILSNSAGTPDDTNFQEAIAIEEQLGIPVIKHHLKKPAGLEETLAFFQLEPCELAVVGDRLLTDVVFGNLHGMYTIHTQILTTNNDNKVAQLVRSIENNIVLPWVKRDVK